jgi:hypothetical protein
LTDTNAASILIPQNIDFDSSITRRLLIAVTVTAQVLLGSGEVAAQPSSTSSQETGTSTTGPISGYMDFHFNKEDGRDGVIDFHRFVLLINHSFSSKLRFVGELELEHALVEGLEEKGELELEQAYVDFLLKREFNLRAGMVLMPIGIIKREARAARLSQCRAPICRHRDYPDDLVRGRCGRSRRTATRLSIPRVRHGAFGRARVHCRRRHS